MEEEEGSEVIPATNRCAESWLRMIPHQLNSYMYVHFPVTYSTVHDYLLLVT